MLESRLGFACAALSSTGAIFVSIDDRELNNLRMVMNKVFGEENFVAAFGG
jgi:adenine-specific DNA-methyltransferase